MQKYLRLTQVWNWLPAFRAIAETPHLPTAAHNLAVSPPALSRTLRLLEEQLGQPLFARQHRRLVLNDAGREFLEATRSAMRLVDDGWDRALDTTLRGPLRIIVATGTSWFHWLPALRALRHAHPQLVPHISSPRGTDLATELLDGSADLALVEGARATPGLTATRLRVMRFHLYCSRQHRLARAKSPTLAQILTHPFVAPAPPLDDRWPPELTRQVAAVTDSLPWALDLCVNQQLLGVFPEAVEKTTHAPHRLPLPRALPSADLYVLHRTFIGNSRGAVGAALDALSARTKR